MGLPQLAPELGYPSLAGNANNRSITGINLTTTLSTVMEVSGKWHISYLTAAFGALGVNVRIKLTVDGVPIWDSTKALSTTVIQHLLGLYDNIPIRYDPVYMFNSTFKLEMSASVPTTLRIDFGARPIK